MFADDFLSALSLENLYPSHIIADSKIHRFSASGDKRDDAGWYVLTIDNDVAFGGFGDHRRNLKVGWSSLRSGDKKPSAAEIQKMNEAQKKAKAQAAKDEKKRNEECQRKAKSIWENASEGINDYIIKKQIKPYNAQLYKGLIVVPIYNDGNLQSVQMISSDGKKKFLYGTKKQGSYLQIGEVTYTLIICEGYATGCSLHEATDLPVIIAFDAYNLVPVSKIFKGLYPDAKIIIAGDNDFAKADNVGEKYARLAADAIGGAQVYLPQASIEQPGRTSLDWNDVHCNDGLSAVRDVFINNSLINDAPEYYENDFSTFSTIEPPFRVLGFDHGKYYYLPIDSDQIVELSASAHTPVNLLRLAPMDYWTKYGDIFGERADLAVAQNALFRECTEAGVFTIGDRIRGIGAWVDHGRHILHCGDVAYVDGVRHKTSEIKSKYIYERREHLTELHSSPLTNKEAYELRLICEALKWENPLSGSLLAGWCVIAPVCAMLPWRPHIWITGESQAGKTTVLTDIVKVMVSPMALMLEGGTTEAAIRQSLGNDARPIIYDEAEAETKKDIAIMEGVLNLARRSASGGSIIKGSASGEAVEFTARSAFCYSGINPSLKQKADESRTSVLHLKRDTNPDRKEKYKAWQEKRTRIITDQYSSRMLARTVANLTALIENCKIFTSAADIVLNDRRAADQIGPMLAGLYLLGSTGRVTIEKAQEFISQYDWTNHTAIAEAPDHDRLIQFLSTSTLRVVKSNETRDVSIGRLINDAHNQDVVAEDELKRLGIMVKSNRVYFANQSPQLAKLLSGQPWQANWKRVLMNLPNAEKTEVVHFCAGLKSRAVSVPLDIFAKDEYSAMYTSTSYTESMDF